MEERKLTEKEYLAIDSILEDAERKYLPKTNVNFDLESLDKQCRDIWSDWDFSVPAFSNSPNKSKLKSVSLLDENNIDGKTIDHFEKPNDQSQKTEKFLLSTGELNGNRDLDSDLPEISDDESSGSEIIYKPSKSPAKSPLLSKGQSIKSNKSRSITNSSRFATPSSGNERKSKNTTTKKSIHKKKSPLTTNHNLNATDISAITSRNEFQAFNRSDLARLRQDNISLKALVTRLRDALDRANGENKRLKEELAKSEMQNARQKQMIDYLKEQKIYGNKK